MSVQYFFAVKIDKVFCFKCNNDYAVKATDFLLDNGYDLFPANEYHFRMQKDAAGGHVQTYTVDKELSFSKNGRW